MLYNRMGQEFWRKLNLVIVFILYGVLLTTAMIFPQYLVESFVVIGFIVVSYIAFQQYYIRKREIENAGTRVMWGWVDHAVGIGEEFEFPVGQIIPDERLSIKDRDAVDNFVDIMTMKKKEKSVRSGFSEIQLVYKPKRVQSLENKNEGELDVKE